MPSFRRCEHLQTWLVWTANAISRIVIALLAVFIAATAAVAQKPSDKPRVPPGVDPGGVAVAIIGSGIDYTRPEIAARLARDGEGELIGWDFVDNDRRPFQSCGRRLDVECTNTPEISVLREAPLVRLVAVRVSDTKPQSLADAMMLSTRTAAKIVLVTITTELALQLVREAGERFQDQLILVGGPAVFDDLDLIQRWKQLPANFQQTMPANVVASNGADVLAGIAARRLALQPGLMPAELARQLNRTPAPTPPSSKP